jgi:hypothetical protein
MSDEDGRARSRGEPTDAERSTRASASRSASCMHARSWVIAYRYGEPADYGIPALPSWSVRRTDAGGVALAEDDDSEAFVRADAPMKVRR